MNKPRRKGTNGENEAVTELRRWWKTTERRALRGVNDAGDLAGPPYTISVKRAESWPIHKWRKELKAMCKNNEGRFGFIMARRNRDEWVYILPEDTFRDLMDAVYGGEKCE